MYPPKKILLQSLAGTVLILLGVLFPDTIEAIRYPFLALVILIVGMPHGALDHVIDGDIENWDPFTFNLKFYSWYLLAVAIYSVVWIYFPLFSFIFFLLITWYHFGQADAERLQWTGFHKNLIHFARGFTVIGLIVYSDISYASSVIEAVSDKSVEAILNSFVSTETARYFIGLFYPVIFIILALFNRTGMNKFLAYLTDALVTSALFLYTDPVWAFAVYFGLWHSFNHVRVMLNYLSKNGWKEATFKWFYFQSFPFSLLSYLGILFIYNILNAFGNEELMVSLLLVVISVLTLPHMMVVEKLYKKFTP